MNFLLKLEYRVRPVTRYIVTKYEETDAGSGVVTVGEYDNADVAYEVCTAIAKTEHARLGWPINDDRILYPEHPDHLNAKPD